jgi:hypothetical protein
VISIWIIEDCEKVLTYLQGTQDYILAYYISDLLEIVGYTDFDFTRCLYSRKLTLVCVILLVGGAVSWKSMK